MSRLGLSLMALSALLLVYDGYCYGSRHGGFAEIYPFAQTGAASWYGIEEQGKLTANGERFNRHEFTAAHRHLPFGTIVRVTNRENGRSVEVRINDRGPYAKGRVLDLSEAAAKALDMKKTGVAPVKIEIVPPDAAHMPASTSP